jgi:hypothetical protein
MAIEPTDAERTELAAICASLAPDQAALLARFLPGGRASQLRLRNEAIRDLASRHYPHLPSTRARAHAIETDLIRMQSIAVRMGLAPDDKRTAIAKVLQANGGQALGWRQIFSILS